MTGRDGATAEILLVENDPGDVRLIREALQDAWIPSHLSVAGDGDQALAHLRRGAAHADAPRPDLILMDLNLPIRSGHDVLAEIKSDPDLKRIPVVVLSTSRAEEDVIRAYNAHANCFISKPLDFDQLTAVVSSTVEYWLCVVRLASS